MDYLFKYTVGNKLPRGKVFSPFRVAENRHKFNCEAKEYNHDIQRLPYKNRISPFLLEQRYILAKAVISGHVRFNTDAIIEVIKMLEGDSHSPSIELIKRNVKFSKKGFLSEYRHHHVPLLPNSYLSMYTARNTKTNQMINLDSLVNLVDKNSHTVDLDSFEKEIRKRGADRGGKMTGHWLITKTISNKNYYLGVFPHSNNSSVDGKSYDDYWIKQQLIESERLLFKKN